MSRRAAPSAEGAVPRALLEHAHARGAMWVREFLRGGPWLVGLASGRAILVNERGHQVSSPMCTTRPAPCAGWPIAGECGAPSGRVELDIASAA